MTALKAPRAVRRRSKRVLHGIERNDAYAWLRDDDWQTVMRRPQALRRDIRAHLEAENAYTAAVLAPTEALQSRLFEEMRARIKEDDSSVPADDGPWAYYHRYETGAQHPRFCRRPVPDGPEQVLYDADAAAKDRAFFHLGDVCHSPDHAKVACAVDDTGSEFYTLWFEDLTSSEVLPHRKIPSAARGGLIDRKVPSAARSGLIDREIPSAARGGLIHRIANTSGRAVWANDARTVFYTVLDEHHRPCKVMRHVVGTDPSNDVVVYEERDPGFFVGVGITENRGHVVIDVHDHQTSELRVIEADRPATAPRLIAMREPGIEYDISEQTGRFVIRANVDGAEDFAVFEAPIGSPTRRHWTSIVPHHPGRLILSVLTFAEHMVRLEREGGLPRIVVRQRQDGAEHTISFDEDAYALGLVPGYEYDTATMRFTYASPTTPTQTIDYDMQRRTKVVRKTQEIPSGHDPSEYRCARFEAASHDGERVPVTVLWHRDTPIDGSAPAVLYGYGAYGLAIPAAFSTTQLSLVDRGFVWAVAHVRGGKDKGYAWYRRGRLMEKKNSFLDFIAAAQALVDGGWSSPDGLTAMGGSAGGMLVGAAVNERPDLFRAAVGQVPFVDVLETMCDADLPLTPPEWPEWGNPLESEAAYRYIASYSPYENVRAQAYPYILATAGLTDPRVTYWEPAKWVAQLRHRKTDDRPVLLHTYMEAGHAGASGRFESLRETALIYAFILFANDRLEPT